jgi:predicted aspartyl protease
MDYTSEIAELLSRHGFRRFAMSRTGVGHLLLAGHLDERPIDIVLDTGSSKTFVELGYCRSEGIAVTDTGQPSARGGNVHTLGEARLMLEGLPVRTDGIFALDMTSTNQALAMRGTAPLRAVLGQDVLRHHDAVIDYATSSLFLRAEPAGESRLDDTSALEELLSRQGFRRFVMSRSQFGHVTLLGQVDSRPIDIVLDTGAGNTFVELGYCRSEGIAVNDTGQPGQGGNVHTLGEALLTLDGLPVRTAGLFAIDMTATNQRLTMKGADPIRAVIGQDVLRNHQAVIDYAALALFLKEE